MKSDYLIRTRPSPACTLCGGLGEQLYSGLHDRLFGASGEWSVSRCLNADCGLLWLDPRPLEEDINKAYASYYTHASLEKSRSLKSRLLSLALRVLVNAVMIGGGLAKERRDVTDMHLNELPPGRMLDIGCGNGEFLYRMKGRGWSVEGLDFDIQAARFAGEKYGIEVRCGKLEEIGYPEGVFDAVTMKHVIEHVFDPVATLCEVYRILKPGGIIVVMTPNAGSLGLRTYGPNWRGLEPPRHIQLFPPRALDAVACKAGLVPVYTYTTATNAWIILSASMLLAENKAGFRPILTKISVGTIARAIVMHYREMRLNVSSRHDGEEIVLVARKGMVVT